MLFERDSNTDSNAVLLRLRYLYIGEPAHGINVIQTVFLKVGFIKNNVKRGYKNMMVKQEQ